MDFDLSKNKFLTKKHKHNSVSYFILIYDSCSKVAVVTDCSNNS